MLHRKRIKFVLAFLAVYLFTGCRQTEDYHQLAAEQIKKFRPKRTDYVIIIDYTRPIFTDRLYVLDMRSKEVVLKSRVSHAFCSGILYARWLSNKPGSNKSCPGSFTTGKTYSGHYGYSMYVHGLERGINHNARDRIIVFHSSKKMCSPWSKGCFATPEDVNKKLIALTRGGCLVLVLT